MNAEKNMPSDGFYKEAISFYNAGKILMNSDERIVDEDTLFSPVVYLFRHSVELIIKAFIIKNISGLNGQNWASCKLPPHNKKISSMHSIQELYDTWTLMELNASDLDLEFIKDVVERIDNYDSNSTFFRYPYDKKGNRHKKELTDVIDEDILNTLPCRVGAFVYSKGIDKFSCLHREQMMDDLVDTLENLVDVLLKYYNPEYVNI